MLRSGLVSPLNCEPVLAGRKEFGGAGPFDRLIPDKYSRWGLRVPPLDMAIAALPDVPPLHEGPGRRL